MLSRNAKTGQTEAKAVTATSVRTVHTVLTLCLADATTGARVETLTATQEHPFYVDGQGFVPAGRLAVGNAIVTRAGPGLIVQSVTWQRHPEGMAVYNFVVDEDHTYFVGKANGGAWVHNPNCVDFAKKFLRKYGGEIYGLTPKPPAIYVTPKAYPPGMGPWFSHYVHVQDGMVRDPMMLLGSNEPIPFGEWQGLWNDWDFHNWGPVPSDQLRNLR